MRLNKYLSQSGVCSRRKADILISEGKVIVNGEVVTELGSQIKEDFDQVFVDKKQVSFNRDDYSYIMFHKPKGCICSSSDDRNRKTIYDYFDIDKKRLFSVGRLDYNTEGLLLLTNDGNLANRLMHPSYEISKKYSVKINSQIAENDLALLRKGIILDDGYKTMPAKVKVVQRMKEITKLEVMITEGKYRQIHRMFSALGKEVVFLKRIDYGPLHLGGLPRGGSRELSLYEVDLLKSHVGES